MSELRWAARTDVGRARDRNEDSFYGGAHVFAVADGLGGHNAGDVASRLAIEPIKALDRRLDDVPPEQVPDTLTDTVIEANRAVYRKAQADAKVRGMGTTLTAVAIGDGAAYLAHVGDSRCYLLRGSAINQLSTDHTLVARMVQEGKLSLEEAEVHPQRSILTRALGAEPDVDVDSLHIALQTGDRLLLCSDGLSSVIGEERIREVLETAGELETGCSKLIDEANAHGGPDNITVVIVEVTGVEGKVRAPVAAPAKRDGRLPRARRERRVPVRGIIWGLALVVLLLGGWLGFRSWVNRSYFVGVDQGKVAIFRGLPTEVGALNLNHVERTTAIPVEQVAPYFRQNLRDGIRVKNLQAAMDVIAELPRVTATPTPTPSPSPTKT